MTTRKTGSKTERDRKYPIGMAVTVEDNAAVVVRHGRNATGIYTRVRFTDGREEDYHRGWIFPAKPAPERWECWTCRDARNDPSRISLPQWVLLGPREAAIHQRMKHDVHSPGHDVRPVSEGVR